ncbi:precorrin-6A/cobalt-precorrin-6A reductase, partial [Acinetobacter baumannii]
IGGFGGVAGLAAYLREQRVTHLVDATHPFAATMSAHAVEAAQMAGIPLIALTRPGWQSAAGDRWTHVSDIAGAVSALA